MKLLHKEWKLATLKLTWVFLAFALMTLIPGYPILMGAFFVCLGLFQSAQAARESSDILYSALLPIPKRDVVKGKYLSAAFLELAAFLLMCVCTALRMTVLAAAPVYSSAPMMPANLVFLGFALLVFAAFNVLFLGGFFRTAWSLGRPFLAFCVAAFLLTGLGETLHHLPGLEALSALSGPALTVQAAVLFVCAAVSVLATFLSLRRAQARFDQLDL